MGSSCLPDDCQDALIISLSFLFQQGFAFVQVCAGNSTRVPHAIDEYLSLGGPLSQERIDVVRGMYAAFGSGDIPAIIAALDPQVEW